MSLWVDDTRGEDDRRLVITGRPQPPELTEEDIPFDDGLVIEGRRVNYGPDGGTTRASLYVMGDLNIDQRRLLLEQLEHEVLSCLQVEVTMRFRAAELLVRIRDEELYRARWNDGTGAFFTTFTEYLEAVLEVWRKLDLMNATSRRQMYDLIRVRELFCVQLGMKPEDILQLGLSHFVKLSEALPYERGSYKLLDLPDTELQAQRKLAPTQVMEIVAQLREAKAGDREVEDLPAWTVGTTAAVVDQARGVKRKNVRAYWTRRGDRYFLRDIVLYEDDEGASAVKGGLTEAQMEHLCQRLGTKPVVE